ncbi:MAG TPA: STAS domain-containing protein [Xanthomonadales bacterium]|nr:STAS domain-containing protein [Xanthomonadales bacterium]
MSEATLQSDNGRAWLAGDLTFATVMTLANSMQTLSGNQGMPGQIDLDQVERIDSAGLTLLLEWQSLFRKQSGSDSLIEIINPPDALLKIARLCDAEEFLTHRSPSRENNASRD